MSVVTELLDRLPNPDGGLRRRFTGGLLFSIITLVGIYWAPGIPTLELAISEAVSSAKLNWSHLNSTGTIIIVFGILFVVGNIVDVIAYVFLNSLFSLFGGKIAYHGIQASFQNAISGKRNTPSLLETEQATYEKLPEYVQHGLQDPYRRQFEVAFRYLVHIAPDDEKHWLHQIDSRNKNLFSVISSAFLAMILLAFMFFSIDLAASRALGSALSQAEKKCYTELVDALRRLSIVDSPQALNLYTGIGQGGVEAISDVEKILQSGPYNETMNRMRERTAMDDSNDPTMIFGRCGTAGPDDKDGSRGRWVFFSVSLFTFLFLLSSLAITYALMLRNSISSALEMLQLRDVIGHGGAETDAEL